MTEGSETFGPRKNLIIFLKNVPVSLILFRDEWLTRPGRVSLFDSRDRDGCPAS